MMYLYIPLVGFFSGIFALFTMYLPPLFPTLLRTTGAGFCYNVDLFDRETIERMAGHFARLVQDAFENPDRRISELELLGAEEEVSAYDWRRTTPEVVLRGADIPRPRA